ncbi:hypothetical protein KCU77_g6249, partial [Aureobasidium melanogenum]
MLFNHCIPPAKQFLHKSCLPSEQHDLYNEDLKQALKKQNALATTQRTVVNAWRDGPFLAMAVDFDWFVLKDRYWNNLRRVSKRYPWPEAVSRLNYAFFMRHVVSNDWQKVQSEGVAKSITGACWAEVLLDKSRPIESTNLIDRFGLLFDKYGLLDLSRCRSAIEERHKLEPTAHVLPTPSAIDSAPVPNRDSSSVANASTASVTESSTICAANLDATALPSQDSPSPASAQISAPLENAVLASSATTQPGVQPAVRPAGQSVVQPVVEPVVQPVVQSVVQSVVQPVTQRADETDASPTIPTVEQPVAQINVNSARTRQSDQSPATTSAILQEEAGGNIQYSPQSRYIMRTRVAAKSALPEPLQPPHTTPTPTRTTPASKRKRPPPTTGPPTPTSQKRTKVFHITRPTPSPTVGSEHAPDETRSEPTTETDAFSELADPSTRQPHQTLVKEAEQFIRTARRDAHAWRASRAAAGENHNLESHPSNMILKLMKTGDYEIATEWRPSPSSPAGSPMHRDDRLRGSADLLCLTLHEAKDLVALRTPIEKPVLVRAGVPDFDTKWFLKQLEIHAGGPSGELVIQGSTLEDPEELTSTMKVKEVIERVSASMDEADPASFQPVNCLDLQTLPSYAHEPSFMTHPRYSLLDVVRVRLQQKLGTFVPIGKQTWKSPLRSTVSRPVDMEQAMHFQLLSSQYTVSNFHEDVMNCTWVKCLAGVKAWFFDLSDQRDDISDVPDGNNQQAAVTYSSGVKLVILKPGDILYMPAGLIVRHAVVTLEGPCVMVGGQKLDGCSLPEQLECMESLMEEPARTNESVPCLQLPDVLDEIISYIMNGPDPDMINADETRSRLRASLVEIRARLSTKLGFQADDALAGAETMTLNSRIGNASMSHGKPSVILYQRLQDASLRICDLPVC